MTCPSFDPHDHAACRRAGMDAAESLCADRRLRLTPVRRRVLELLLAAPKAQGAYDVLSGLNRDAPPRQPPAAYRALDFLVAHGLAHRIERLNAYVACASPGSTHRPAFLICRACDRVAETPDLTPDRLKREADAQGFRIEATVVEAVGLCPACAP
ncbi:Fur family transcriptional regulator [Palleronia rufa]|uniref:Fur family transcriptional regulator n=1 Tax=Palleronia rufa TaxID=1530186 RepID=UPI000569F7DB|nr:Fur family transcriptional regulator [Palleronia rufa]